MVVRSLFFGANGSFAVDANVWVVVTYDEGPCEECTYGPMTAAEADRFVSSGEVFDGDDEANVTQVEVLPAVACKVMNGTTIVGRHG